MNSDHGKDSFIQETAKIIWKNEKKENVSHVLNICCFWCCFNFLIIFIRWLAKR